ncbi:hypothetical protein ACF0H5_002211 [Mactra antiquata]
MVLLKTYYLRVSLREVILVEIYGLGNDCTDTKDSNWLQDRHLQEIVQLLYPTVTQYIETEANKKLTNTTKQKHQNPTDILTGSTVRFGYCFKTHVGRQTCLYEDHTSTDDCQLNSLYVMKDKIAVYAHPLISGSPSGMSKIVRALKRKSIGQNVGISSYFQKQSSQTVSLSQLDSLSYKSPVKQSIGDQSSKEDQQENDDVKITQTPPSEGRRNKIKNILERGEIRYTKPQKKKVRHLHEAIINEESKTESTKSDADLSPILKTDSDSQSNFKTLENCSAKTSKSSVCSKSSESFMIGNVKVEPVHSSVLDLDINDKRDVGENSVTLISVEQVNDMKKDLNVNKPLFVSPSQTGYLSDKSNIGSQSSSPYGNQSEPHSDNSDDLSILPSASFCMKPTNRKSNTVNKKQLEMFLKSNGAKNSPKTDTIKLNKSETTSSVTNRIKDSENISSKVSKIQSTVDCISDNYDRQTAFSTVNKLGSQGSQKGCLKRKFPNFSDTDSEDSLPEKKQKIKKNNIEKKFVNLDSMKSNSKKLNISKSFMIGDSGKAQPTLSYFMSKSTSREKSDDVTDSSSVSLSFKNDDITTDGTDTCGSSCTDSQPVIIKDEADLLLKEEIQSMNSIEELNENHLQYLVRKNTSYLRQIFEGKRFCERHMDYKSGGSKKSKEV